MKACRSRSCDLILGYFLNSACSSDDVSSTVKGLGTCAPPNVPGAVEVGMGTVTFATTGWVFGPGSGG